MGGELYVGLSSSSLLNVLDKIYDGIAHREQKNATSTRSLSDTTRRRPRPPCLPSGEGQVLEALLEVRSLGGYR